MQKTRRRKRTAAKSNRSNSPYLSIPYRQLRNPFPPYEIASQEKIEEIHEASMHILENTGMRFQDKEALDLWAQAGAKVNHATEHVWIDRGLLMSLIEQAPASFTYRARNPKRSRLIGENAINFFPNAGMVFASDLQRGRRPGQRDDYITFTKLGQMTNVVHFAPVAAVVMHDVPVHEKHLQNYSVSAILSDKLLMGSSHGRIIANDIINMARIIFGNDLQPEMGPVTGCNINVNSPLVYDNRMIGGMMTFAEHGQVSIVTPFILAGAMSPITIAAAVAQQNAEALAGIALLQLVRPGAPAIYGGFTTNVDMRSGAPAFGTPEGAWALLIGAQLARYYELPYRGSGSLNTSNVPDGQAMGESLWTLWPAIMAHTHVVVHACGWLESGLTASLEKYVMDVENLAMMQHFLQGPEWGGDVFALDAIDEVGPAGHHFGTAHTQARFENAFYPNFLHDRRNFGTWQEGGSEDAAVRASKIWQQVVKAYQKPPMDEAVQEALEDYVVRRTAELEGVELYD